MLLVDNDNVLGENRANYMWYEVFYFLKIISIFLQNEVNLFSVYCDV